MNKESNKWMSKKWMPVAFGILAFLAVLGLGVIVLKALDSYASTNCENCAKLAAASLGKSGTAGKAPRVKIAQSSTPFNDAPIGHVKSDTKSNVTDGVFNYTFHQEFPVNWGGPAVITKSGSLMCNDASNTNCQLTLQWEGVGAGLNPSTFEINADEARVFNGFYTEGEDEMVNDAVFAKLLYSSKEDEKDKKENCKKNEKIFLESCIKNCTEKKCEKSCKNDAKQITKNCIEEDLQVSGIDWDRFRDYAFTITDIPNGKKLTAVVDPMFRWNAFDDIDPNSPTFDQYFEGRSADAREAFVKAVNEERNCTPPGYISLTDKEKEALKPCLVFSKAFADNVDQDDFDGFDGSEKLYGSFYIKGFEPRYLPHEGFNSWVFDPQREVWDYFTPYRPYLTFSIGLLEKARPDGGLRVDQDTFFYSVIGEPDEGGGGVAEEDDALFYRDINKFRLDENSERRNYLDMEFKYVDGVIDYFGEVEDTANMWILSVGHQGFGEDGERNLSLQSATEAKGDETGWNVVGSYNQDFDPYDPANWDYPYHPCFEGYNQDVLGYRFTGDTIGLGEGHDCGG